ncbi:hypothetical protein HDU87_003141 [Geranomyces variabilis]|uniref:Nucleoporin Nup159/Nup146 N-terminal domain-containing protein n=1 Tax=Geranomyces variabilis TaxID=109894 RepID=A0AAD5TKF4_9FUNG|nr:hypothetical protein HDU87_003141 [Geranomyces variabilis]
MPDVQGEEIDAGDVDWETLRFKPLQVEAKLRLSEPLDAPENCSLLATSSKYGYAVCGTTEGFAFALLKDVRSALREATKGTIVPFPNSQLVSIPNDPVVHLKLSADQLVIVACTASGALYLYGVDGAGSGAPPTLLKQLKLDGPVLDIQPNPEFMPQSAAVLSMEGRVQIVGFSENIAALPLTDVTTMSWSKKGKQLACGLKDGSIVQVTPEGVEKRRIPPPPSLNNQPVSHLSWIETPTFVVTYGLLDPEDTSGCPVYVVTQTGVPKVSTYIKLRDPLFPEDGRKSHYYMEHFPALSNNIMHMIACGNANAVELGFFGCDKDGAWANWTLGDGMGVETPLNAAQDNTYLVGLAVDVTSEEELPPDTPDAPATPPVPILLTYTTEGLLLAYHCLDDSTSSSPDGRCEMMCKAEAIPGSASAKTAQSTVLAKPATIAAPSAAPASAPTSLFGANSFGSAASAAPPTMFGAKPPAQAAPPSALTKPPEAKAAPLFPAFGTAPKSALPGQASPGFGAALKTAEPTKAGPPSAPTSGLFGTKPTAGGASPGFGQKVADTPKMASGLTGVRGLAGPKPSLPPSVSPAPTVKLQPATPLATKTASSMPTSRSSPIPTVQSVVKPVLAASTRQSPQPAAMQPLRTTAPAESDPPEIIQSKFIEMYDAFCDEMKNFGVRVKASAKTVEKAKTPVLTNGQHGFEEWTLADLPLLVDRTSVVAKKAQSHQQRLAALHEETKMLLASLPQEVALANECQRRLDALDDPDTAQHMRDAPLGPEDADLRDSILQRYKSVERSLQRVQDYMEQLRCEERGAANRQLLRKPDWQTICAITTHITRGTENHLQVLERLQMRIHSLQPKAKTAATAAEPARKQRGYGLLVNSDSDSDSDREDEIVGTAAKADASIQRQAAFRGLLKAAAGDPSREARLNQRAHTHHAALCLKDPEAFAKARAAMLLPPADSDRAAPRTPRTTKDVLAAINADMKFPEIKEEPVMVQQQQGIPEPAKSKEESPQAPSPQPLSFGFGSPGTSVFHTPSKMPTAGFGGFGKPSVFDAPAVVKTEKESAGAGWIKVESEVQRPAVSRADTTSTKSVQAPFSSQVEEASTVSFASSAGTKADVPSLSASPSPAPKPVARRLSFSAATVKAEIEEPPVREEEPASVTDDEVFTSSALGSESGWVNVKDEQPGSREDVDDQPNLQESAGPSSADAVTGQEQQADVEAAIEEGEQDNKSVLGQQEETAEIEEGEIVLSDESMPVVEESTIEETSIAEYTAEEVAPSTVVEDSSLASEMPSSGLVSYGQSDSEDDADVTAIQGESTIPDESSSVPDKSSDAFASVVDVTEELEPTETGGVEEEVSTVEPSSVEEPPSPPSPPADENAMDEGQPADDGLASAFGTGFGSLGTSAAPTSATSKPSVFGGFGSTASAAPAFASAAASPAFGSAMPKPSASAFGSSAAAASPFGSLAQQQQTPGPSAAASVFGQPATSAPATAAPAFGFGTSASATPASAFGRTASPFGQPAATPSSSGFGSTALQPAASVFGQNAPSSSSGFGTSVPAAAAFGQSQTTSYGFGSSSGGGAATASAFGSPFGGSMASAAGAQFGSRPAGFGPSAFGASPAAAGAGAGGGVAGGAVFGGSPLAANTGGLGAMAQSIKQASQSGGGFGSYAAKPAGFAGGASPGFGGFGAQQPAQSGFGGFGSQQQQQQPQTPQQQTTFGGFGGVAAGMQQNNDAASVFGSAARNTASPFGSGGSVFGSQQQQQQTGGSGGFGGFGAAANGSGAFGQQQPAAASVFGASTNNAASVFGSNSGTPANKFASFGSHRG